MNTHVQYRKSIGSALGERHVCAAILSLVCANLLMRAAAAETHWYKGQLHCHAENVSIGVAMQKYRDAGFDFVALSKKNAVGETSLYTTSTFLAVPNDELEYDWNHVCAVNLRGGHPPGSPTTLKAVVDMALNEGALPQINHPHLSGHTVDDILGAEGAVFLEVMQRYDSLGYDAQLWDGVLSTGRKIFGTATDDAHDYTNDYNWGWVMVRAAALTNEDIVAALAAGDFYASTGPSISRIDMINRELTVTAADGERIVFMGRGGAVLDEQEGDSASYRLPDSQSYVRAVVVRADGKRAYTQPYFPGPTNVAHNRTHQQSAAYGRGVGLRVSDAGNVIAYSVGGSREEPVRLTIHALNGRRVGVLVDHRLAAAGTYSFVWNGANDEVRAQGAGAYVCRLQARGVRQSALLNCCSTRH